MGNNKRPILFTLKGEEFRGNVIHIGTVGTADTRLYTEVMVELADGSVALVESNDILKFLDAEIKEERSKATQHFLMGKNDIEKLNLSKEKRMDFADTFIGVKVYERKNKVLTQVGTVIDMIYHEFADVLDINGDIEVIEGVSLKGKHFETKLYLISEGFSVNYIELVPNEKI